ncbi:hypothetical protein BOX15_Mlig021735g1 [Macrostomum lignano]|uniref:Uncharacterized protein n=1 Tax=Macrostomum lignano TaxID=282301 RepID=A0A267ER29_9PLAT|nr:hypothetical protein BOX15_Mlig021735g1 [Macrostomum lignano]
MFPIVLSTNETYIRRLGDKYECTSAVQVRYSLDQQVACFLFHLDDEASGELRKVRMYHAWCSELDRKTKPNFTVRVPARVHKHCKVYAVAVKFKDPHSWLKFQPDMERDRQQLESSGAYHCWELLPEGKVCNTASKDEKDYPCPMIIAAMIAENYQSLRLDLYTDATCVFVPSFDSVDNSSICAS